MNPRPLIALLSLCLSLTPTIVSAAAPAAPATSGPLRLASGQLLFNHRPAAAIGVNYFDGFRRLLDPSTPKSEALGYVEGLRVLAEHEIPFARFAACGFYPNELRLYRDDPQRYFGLLDGFVAEAEKQQVGLIPCLFWAFFAAPDLVGEPIQSWGDPASNTREFMRRYTTDVVTRYRNSPAIWAWQFGNEFLLEADLPEHDPANVWIVPQLGTPTKRTAADLLRSADVIAAYKDFAETVRSLDPVRPIMTGNTVPRASSWHLRRGLGWEPDTREQSAAVVSEDNPDPNSMISGHMYANFCNEPHYFPAKTGIGESIAIWQELAKSTGKPFFLGEFGADPKATPEARRTQTETYVAEIVRQRVPLSALWVYDTLNTDVAVWNVRADNENAYALTLLRDANRHLRATAPTPAR
jgi:hypothetical protein